MKFSPLGIMCILAISKASLACKYWCRKPMSFEYVCCDEGNPFSKSEVTSSPKTSTTLETTAFHQLSTNYPKSCRYYCIYNGNVYCCDDGSSPIPNDHDEHDGRCPVKKEQVCKKGGIYLHIHASKMTNKKGGKKLSHKGRKDDHAICASDGYCEEDEKCCENLCAKKHTCLKALYDYRGFRKTIIKKKTTRN